MLLRDWPLVLVICFANFLTNIIAWGPMPPVVEKHSGAKVPFSTRMTLWLYLIIFASHGPHTSQEGSHKHCW